jgi:hypothetical protein
MGKDGYTTEAIRSRVVYGVITSEGPNDSIVFVKDRIGV